MLSSRVTAFWNAQKFKPGAVRNSFAMAQSPIGMWLKSTSAPTLGITCGDTAEAVAFRRRAA
jgi:hypothetical protein